MSSDVVYLFPGQGAYVPGALANLHARYPRVDAVMSAVEEIPGAAGLTELLLSPSAPDLDHLLSTNPDQAQLAIYTTSVAVAAALDATGVYPTILVGHSFGEIAAMVVAGAFTVADGAEIVLARQAALRRAPAGTMAALACSWRTAETIASLVGTDRITVAVDNGSGQTVISGTEAAVDAALQIARAARVPAVAVKAVRPFHNPLLADVVPELAMRLRGIRQHPLRHSVHSPILGRAYDDSDGLTDCLASHLVRPVRFGSMVERVGVSTPTWVEVGAGTALTRIVRRVLPAATAHACLDGRDGFETVVTALAGTTPSATPEATPVRPAATAMSMPTPPVVPEAPVAPEAQGTSPHLTSAAVTAAPVAPTPARPAVAGAAPVAPASLTLVPPVAPEPATIAAVRESVGAELRALYAEALEYPEEVFTDDVLLERDLGIDSVKQTELLARAAERFGLPPRPENLRLADYETMGKVVDYVMARSAITEDPQPERVLA